MSSSRLPGKVLKKLNGMSVIECVFNQLSYSKNISKVVLATTIDKTDDDLENWAIKNNIYYHRGSLNDVLDRYYQTAKKYFADVVIRVTADCPLIDPEIVDLVIDEFNSDNYDYVSNVVPPTYPDGLDTEVFSFHTLEKVWKKAMLKSDREHVTTYIRNNLNEFRTKNVSYSENLEHLRWTLDNQEDYEFLKIIYKSLYKRNSFIKMNEVLELLNTKKDLMDLNSHIKRNEGYQKSVSNDQL